MPDVQLFCFTFAGGAASFFDTIDGDFRNLDLVKIEYPGHGSRHKEQLLTDPEALAEDAFQQMEKHYSGGRYGLFGYSMGAVTLIEVLRHILSKREMIRPSHVFLAAHEPHTKTELEGFAEDRRDLWIKERTLQFGGIPDKLIHNDTFWRMYLPIYRADYTLIKNYRFEEITLKTKIPATIFYSETDTPKREMKKWSKYFIGDCGYYCFEGNHFFIRDHHTEIAQIIMDKLKA
jgi:surfactin synthase thioesterase subunit